MKRLFCALCFGFVYLAVVTFCSSQMSAAATLPGVPVDDEVLDRVRAAGCSQFASTQGQVNCTGAYGCPYDLATLQCENSTASCPSCTGGTDIVCAGDDESDTLCTQYTDTCCTATKKCVDVSGGCNCDFGGGGSIGSRKRVRITFNSGCLNGGD